MLTEGQIDSFADPVKGLAVTNMLEEVTKDLPAVWDIELSFRLRIGLYQ